MKLLKTIYWFLMAHFDTYENEIFTSMDGCWNDYKFMKIK